MTKAMIVIESEILRISMDLLDLRKSESEEQLSDQEKLNNLTIQLMILKTVQQKILILGDV